MQSTCRKIQDWGHTQLVVPLQQMTLLERFVCIFIGLWFGIFPIPGTSTPLLFLGIFLINRVVEHPMSISETTVAAAINLIATPICIALMPVWMQSGISIFQLSSLSCSASEIIQNL